MSQEANYRNISKFTLILRSMRFCNHFLFNIKWKSIDMIKYFSFSYNSILTFSFVTKDIKISSNVCVEHAL